MTRSRKLTNSDARSRPLAADHPGQHRVRRVERPRVVLGVEADLDVEQVVHQVVGHVGQHDADQRRARTGRGGSRRCARRAARRRAPAVSVIGSTDARVSTSHFDTGSSRPVRRVGGAQHVPPLGEQARFASVLRNVSHGREPRPWSSGGRPARAGLEGVDRVGVAQGEADVVEALEQAVAVKSSSGNGTSMPAAGTRSRRSTTSTVTSSVGSASTAAISASPTSAVDLHGHQPGLGGVVAEDVAEAGRDDGPEAVVGERPHRVLARRAGAEVRAGDEDHRVAGSARR